ncbi:MAG: ATP-binding protein [Hyphomonadaceae bacterium]|nr:ATP-binding protein [Hyphomonadaceae bacterium]
MPVSLGDFVEKARPISASSPLSHVVELFQNDPSAQYFILVRDKRPAGLISRTLAFEFAISAGTGDQIQLPVGELISARALILKAETPIRDFVAKIGSKIEAVVSRGCIVVEDKRFKGVLSPGKLQEALVTAVAESQTQPSKVSPAPVKRSESANESPLLGTLAHEIRTPLTAIMGLSEMLMNRTRDDYEKDLAQTIVRSSQTLDRILTDTLDYASLEAGQLNVRSEATDLTELANDIRRLWGAEASRRGLALRVGFVPDGPHHVLADHGRIRQIANNLVSNALKFTREGEVAVTMSTQPVGQSLMLTLSVTDTGRGLTEPQRERFMKVFEKGPEIDGAKGWGLGLTISRALAHALGGQLAHSNNPVGGGSVFTLTVPVERGIEEMTRSEPTGPRKGKFELGDVLLVEDHEASAMVVINALEHAGWTVHHAGTLHAAGSYVALNQFQAILTDLHLPDGNAMNFIDGLRRQGGINSATPVIAMTADVSESRRDACIAMGADRALKKPIAGPELVATIADVLMSRAAGHVSTVELRGRLAS